MFNFLAAALMVYLMVNVLIAPGSMSPESREFGAATHLPQMHEVLAPLGVILTATPLNLSVVLAAALCVFVWLLVWHTPFGFELRTTGHSATAAVYAGVRPRRIIMIAMCLSGAIAGCVGLNEIMGVHHRLLLNFTAGYGFTGIAVALMGRAHPVGIVLASILFGMFYQGGAELAFDIPSITREMVVVIQGLVILFSGALAHLPRPWLQMLLSKRVS
jgi:simple sugar transport system permease protein